MKYILILLLFISCGTRKTDSNFFSIETDSIIIENNRILTQNIRFNDIGSIKPFDVTKPLIIDGVVYYNSIISYDKSKFENFEVKDFNKSVDLKKEAVNKGKTTEKTDNTILFLGLFFIFCLFVFLWFKTGS